jgi:ring-1,2-phenylacetyl-CoA epoxidase subunit PaaC
MQTCERAKFNTMKTHQFNDIVQLVLSYADNALILGHRNSEWTGHGPILEQDIAITNISLDLVGQARNFYQYAADLINNSNPMGKGLAATEDTLAYLRDAWDFRNCLLVEQDNGDWAKTILRQFLFSIFQGLQYEALKQSKDRMLSAIAEKASKECKYHIRWSSEWVIRLGCGTEESFRRMQEAIDSLWKFSDELFVPTEYERSAASLGIAPDPAALYAPWLARIKDVLEQALIVMPPKNAKALTGGKQGIHTEHLGYVLAEMQFLQRTYPGCEW